MSKQTSKLVINIVGYPGSGKSSVCEPLTDQGFLIHRPSDILRAYAAKHGIQLTGRQDYVNLHRAMNNDNPYFIIEPVINSTDTKICIDGLRCPVLLDKLQAEVRNVITIALDCPIEERFKRVQTDDIRRNTHRAPANLKAFRADELLDYTNPDRNLPNMEEMMARADYTIDASKTPQQIADDLFAILKHQLAITL